METEREPEAGGERPRPGRHVVRYIASALALVTIIAAAIFVHSRLRPEMRRSPVEFLPLSTRAAFAVDTRPEGPGARRMREVWPESDVQHLSERGTAVAQGLVDWTGLDLDLGEDAAAWYGHELVVGALAAPEGMSPGPRSAVVVARVTSLRRARAALDRAAGPPSRELEWRRSVVKSGRDRITVWREPSGKEQIAYVARDGCVLVGGSREVVARCLEAADDPGQRLAATEAFRQDVSQLSAGALAWAYLDAAHLGQGLRRVVPGIWHGWGDVLRGFLGGASRTSTRRRLEQETTGAVAVALAPEREGVRLRGRYWRSSPRESDDTPSKLDALGAVLPETTVAYVLAHEPAGWLPFIGDMALSGARGEEQDGGAGAGLFALLIPWLGSDAFPHDVLVASVRVADEGKTAVVVAAPSDQMSVPQGGFAGLMLSGLAWKTFGEVTVVATDESALERCAAAAEDPRLRLPMEPSDDLRFEAWAKPAAISKRLARFQEIHVRSWESASGGEAEAVLKVRPRDLLGSG